jgi:hypothetical protein
MHTKPAQGTRPVFRRYQKKNLENEAKTDFIDCPDDPSKGKLGMSTKPFLRPSGRAGQW